MEHLKEQKDAPVFLHPQIDGSLLDLWSPFAIHPVGPVCRSLF